MISHYFFLLLALFFSVFVSVSGGAIGLDHYVALTQEHDDNIFYSEEEETKDDVTTYSYGIGIHDRSERLDLSASAELDWKEYSENPDLSGLDRQFGAALLSSLTEKLSLSAETVYSMDSKRDRDFEESGMVDETEVLERVVRTRMISELSTEYALSEISTAGVLYRYSRSDYDDPEFADYFSHNAGVGLERNISGIFPETRADVWVNYIRYESVFPQFNTREEIEQVVDNYSVVAGITTSLSEKLDVMVHLGGRYTDSTSTTRNGNEDQSEYDTWGRGTVGSLKCRYEGEYTSYDISLTHDMKPRSKTGGLVNNTSSVFRLRHRLTEKIRIGVAAGYYLSWSEGAFSSEEVDEYAMSLRPGIEYAISKHFFLEGSYTYRSVMDETDNSETERNLIMGRISYRYPINNQ